MSAEARVGRGRLDNCVANMIFFTFSPPVRGNEAEEREIRVSADSKMNGLFYQQLKRVTPN